jgi:serine/threonine protein kinase
VGEAVSRAGPHQFIAPEILANQEIQQSPKADIWSLFVTISYKLDVNGYQENMKKAKTDDAVCKLVLQAANCPVMVKLKDMTILDPERRASAAQMLLKHFEGRGLSTPRDEV